MCFFQNCIQYYTSNCIRKWWNVFSVLLWVSEWKLCPTLCNTTDYPVHGVLQARILEWVSQSVQSCPTLCDLMDRSMLGLPVHHQLLEFTQTHIHWVGDAIQPSHPLLSSSPAFGLSQCQVFSSESALRIRWPQYWRFSFSISPSSEYSRLISFRTNWFELLAVQGTLKSLLQHHSSKASIPGHSAFFMVQLSHLYMATGRTIALTRWTFVCKGPHYRGMIN